MQWDAIHHPACSLAALRKDAAWDLTSKGTSLKQLLPAERLHEGQSTTSSTLPGFLYTSESLPDIYPSMASLPNIAEGITFDNLPDMPDVLSNHKAFEPIPDDPSVEVSEGSREVSEDEFVDRLWNFERGESSGYKTRSLNGYHVGASLKIRSASAGKLVDAVVIDSQGDYVKVLYYLGNRCCTKVLSTVDLEVAPSTVREITAGTPVLVRSSTINAWFKGTALWCRKGMVKIHFWHNGRSLVKILPKTSPHLRACLHKRHDKVGEPGTARVEASPGGEPKNLKVGMPVTCVTSMGCLAEGVVTDVRGPRAKVQFFRGDQCCLKIVPACRLLPAATDCPVERKESSRTRPRSPAR
mmetsp:Transcript_63244/g.184812  ORF Transcript_63244/g.184812 Transcript_63244/m.184812 type:complete len:355 (+) Transcript_63244:90-1154(+)